MTKLKVFIFLALFLSFIGNSSAGEKTIEVHDAWIKEGPPSSKVLAGYLAIANNGEKVIILTKVDSPSFDKVMIHKSEMKDGFATMIHIDMLEILPRKTIIFQPGGYHLMLNIAENHFKAGDKAAFTLRFSNGQKITVDAVVKKERAPMNKHQHH